MTDPKDGLPTLPDVSTDRRTFLKGSVAGIALIGGSDYVKPALQALGVSRAQGLLSPPPPPPPTGASHGCTPGFWGNSGNSTAGGKEWWNALNDPDWTANGGVGTNPFAHGTVFNSFFTAHAALAGQTMLQAIDNGGGSVAAQKAARDLVAAYLNSSFGAGYPYTPTQLQTMWTAAVAGGDTTLQALHELLNATNERCDDG